MLEIEITQTNIITGGVEVFARVWQDGIQIGFGHDGSVDIERFRIFNPPVLVLDNTGDIVRTSTINITGTEETIIDIYREDPEEAILQSLEHIIEVKTEKFDATNIIAGKVGNTTSTFYPAAGANSPVDGRLETNEGTWAGSRADTTAASADVTGTNNIVIQSEDAGTAPISRCPFLFDTSTLGTDDISSATFSLSSSANGNNSETTYPADLQLVEVTLASNSNLVVADFDIANWGSTKLIQRYDLGTFIASSGYKDMLLNSAGLAAINKTGVSSFGVRGENDVDNTAPTARSYALGYYADQTGTAQDPKLVVEHTVGVTPVQNSNFLPILM